MRKRFKLKLTEKRGSAFLSSSPGLNSCEEFKLKLCLTSVIYGLINKFILSKPTLKILVMVSHFHFTFASAAVHTYLHPHHPHLFLVSLFSTSVLQMKYGCLHSENQEKVWTPLPRARSLTPITRIFPNKMLRSQNCNILPKCTFLFASFFLSPCSCFSLLFLAFSLSLCPESFLFRSTWKCL